MIADKLNLTRTGEWRSTANEGPWYRDEQAGVVIHGSWGTTGNNFDGWRKRKFYVVLVKGVEIDRVPRLEAAKRKALRELNKTPAETRAVEN